MSKASLMNKAPWSTKSQKMLPVSWNAYTKTFSIVLTGLKDVVGKDLIEVEWSPEITYVVRIKKVGDPKWSFGFETPLTECGFVDLEPNTEYEMEVRSKNKHGESASVSTKICTGSQGSIPEK